MSEETPSVPTKPRRWIAVAVLVAVAAMVVEVVSGVTIYSVFGSWSDRGNFGQMFGAVSALFSAFALAAVAISIVLQSEELSLQRQELEFTRRELQRSADAQVATVELFRRQLEETQISLEEDRVRHRELSAPVFRYVNASATAGRMDLLLVNEGAQVRDLRVFSKGSYGIAIPKPSDVLQTGQELHLPVSFSSTHPSEVVLELSFRDTSGENRRVRVTCDIERHSAHTQEL
jgi:hypothetical protein